jgi:hypothetical protein
MTGPISVWFDGSGEVCDKRALNFGASLTDPLKDLFWKAKRRLLKCLA